MNFDEDPLSRYHIGSFWRITSMRWVSHAPDLPECLSVLYCVCQCVVQDDLCHANLDYIDICVQHFVVRVSEGLHSSFLNLEKECLSLLRGSKARQDMHLITIPDGIFRNQVKKTAYSISTQSVQVKPLSNTASTLHGHNGHTKLAPR